MILDIAKILVVLGIIFIIMKGLGKQLEGIYEKLYILHKAAPAFATILAFVHGLTIIPLNQNYVLTGWFLGFCMLALLILGVFLGFQSGWVPFDDEKNHQFKPLRIIKWILTVIMIIALGAHYLL
jgi:hypothetical protein